LTLYQDDIVEEEDIRKWHSSPASRGEGGRVSEPQLSNLRKCWLVGKRMIEQFDEQESEESEGE
jgi:translation initiation factor eIF-2B subunit epsilon